MLHLHQMTVVALVSKPKQIRLSPTWLDPPRRGSLNFHPGVTLLLSHSNSSSKFQAEAGIVTALARARCWYRLRGMINIVLQVMYALQLLIHTYIDGCGLQHATYCWGWINRRG